MDEEEVHIELESDGDSDSGAYFLEPTACASSIAERIAEANRQLFDPQSPVQPGDDPRSPKVKFSEELVDFAPDHQGYSTEEGDSIANISEEEIVSALKESLDSALVLQCDDDSALVGDETFLTDEDPHPDRELRGEEEEEEQVVACEETEKTRPSKVLLVLLPREQSSSCESVMGDVDVSSEASDSDNNPGIAEVKEHSQRPEQKIRPKSAHKNSKCQKQQCKLSPVSPELDCTVEADNKSWHESQRIRSKVVKVERLREVSKERCTTASIEIPRERMVPVIRPKTAPSKRSCCVVRSDLPRYNGLRSEYGLSAEQLQERKVRSAELRQKLKSYKKTRQQEDRQKQLENEEKFGQWLGVKTARPKPPQSAKVDTLIRSDMYIQKNAVYASKCAVSYAVNYSLGRTGRNTTQKSHTRNKTVNIGKLFEKLSPNAQRTYQISLDANS